VGTVDVPGGALVCSGLGAVERECLFDRDGARRGFILVAMPIRAVWSVAAWWTT
jgi:hypothetical protein